MKHLLRVIIKNILKIFFVCPINNAKVYLVNFNGTTYGYEAKAFAEYLLTEHPGEYELIWEVTDKRNFNGIKDINFIFKNSLLAIYHSLTAGILLFNTTPRSYLPYRKGQYIIETWHGYPFKKVGKYAIRYNQAVYSIPTIYSSHSVFYEENVVRDSFEFQGKVLNCGSPRNDIFFASNKLSRLKEIRSKFNFGSKKIALYAPTFRGDYELVKNELDFEYLQSALERKFGGEWIVLKRYHPMTVAKLDKNAVNMCETDVSFYPDMQELLLISDVLISDYSGSIWDFSLQKKPVFLFTPDLEVYTQSRGLYYPHDMLPYDICKSEKELIDNICKFDYSEYMTKLNDYFEDMGCHEKGKACESIVNDYKLFLKNII